MKLKLKEDATGQEVFRPEKKIFEPGEVKDVSTDFFEAHGDRDIFVKMCECEECGDVFETEKGLNLHISQVHGE